jgi:hypothetical protein
MVSVFWEILWLLTTVAMQRRTTQTDLAEFRTVQNGGKAGRVSPWTRRRRRRALRAKNTGRVS